jgi:hypothetical protein
MGVGETNNRGRDVKHEVHINPYIFSIISDVRNEMKPSMILPE